MKTVTHLIARFGAPVAWGALAGAAEAADSISSGLPAPWAAVVAAVAVWLIGEARRRETTPTT